MGRSARSALPHPGARNAAPSAPSRVINRPDGGVAEVSGSPITSLPAVVEGEGHDKLVSSPNLGSNPGGDPVMSVIDEDGIDASPPIPKYIVENDKEKNVSGNGYRFTLRPGKVVDATNYDIPLLKRQGVKLRQLSAEELAAL